MNSKGTLGSHIYYDQTTSLCEICHIPVQAKVIFEGGNVYYLKYCPLHSHQKSLISTDIEYFKSSRQYIRPMKNFGPPEGKIENGCPLDCGLCEDHEQHTAVGIIELLDECNMQCPTCIAASRPGAGKVKTLDQIELMLDTLVRSEGEADVVMLSGGEPTIHPRILEAIALAKRKKIKHVMVISNGVRIANDKEFVQGLAELRDNFEIYLQFDSLNQAVLEDIRGEDLRRVRLNALRNLEEAKIHSTLVCVVKNGLNEEEVGDVIQFAQRYKYVRGVTFQPCKDIGRNLNYDRDTNHITLSEVRKQIIKNSDLFDSEDLMPHPLSPENICIGYAVKEQDTLKPVTNLLFSPTSKLLSKKDHENFVSSLYFLPEYSNEKVQYESLFRVSIVSFLDEYNFSAEAARRSAIHFITPSEQIIPIDTYYLLYASGVHENPADDLIHIS